MRTAAELNIETIAVYAPDDAASPHVRAADRALELSGDGPAAYLDIARIVEAAGRTGADAVHPGYGFSAERPDFARACEEAGLIFLGPTADNLALFGDKAAARRHAEACGVPLLAGTSAPTTLEEARAFFESLGKGAAVLIKAVAGGGGRGIRVATTAAELEEAFERCASEAERAFGCRDLYVEEFLSAARHIEVQIAGDGGGMVVALGERDCSIQRRHQKLIEVAPAPALDEALRARLLDYAAELGRRARYRSLGTMEFLVRADRIAFLEGNARIQVEHPVTEEAFGIDLVALQLDIAEGRTDVLRQIPERPRAAAAEARIYLERIESDGTVRPAGGTISTLVMPSGPGVRVDACAECGQALNPRYDSLVAKIVARASNGDPAAALRKLARALSETVVGGSDSTVQLASMVAAAPELAAGQADTTWLDRNLGRLLEAAARPGRGGTGEEAVANTPASGSDSAVAGCGDDARADGVPTRGPRRQAGGRPAGNLDAATHRGGDCSAGNDSHPAHASAKPAGTGAQTDDSRSTAAQCRDGLIRVVAPMQATVVSVAVQPDSEVAAGATVVVLEALKMEHVITAPASGIVGAVHAAPGELVAEGDVLAIINPVESPEQAHHEQAPVDLDAIRPDLAETIARHRIGLDANRPEAVARRHERGRRTARENVADLVDPGSFVEYGALVVAAQSQRRDADDLRRNTPADGLIAGIGRVNGELFGPERSRCAVMAYDCTVLGGSQGAKNHQKTDRMIEIARQSRLPVVFFAEGGGGRPGDTDYPTISGLECETFARWGALSGLVPLVGINAGYCFAGNAVILGCSDVVIATEDSNVGMAGPAMIEGGGLGVYHPSEIGPAAVQRANGVIDVVVGDEAEAVGVAKKYLGYFQGDLPDWQASDQRELRHVVPENRRRAYDVRRVLDVLFDSGSLLELRRGFGHGVVTALARVEGRPLGVVANNPMHLGGAIDGDAADKAARFMQLCDAFDLPLLYLCDTPGFMVGPEAEKSALVRRASRMFVVAGSMTVPVGTVVLRKGYGLGAQAMASGSFRSPRFIVGWPTSEYGPMGLEGAVKLGFRKEIEAIEDPEQREQLYHRIVAMAYERGRGLNVAANFEIDDVIDPAETRGWISTVLTAQPSPPRRGGKKRPMVDTW